MKGSVISEKRVFYALAFTVYVYLLILNLLTPMLADDFNYSNIETFGQVFTKEYGHYRTWSGRTVAHLLVRSSFLLPSILAKGLNAAAYVLLTLVVYALSCPNRRFDTMLYAAVVLMLWVFLPGYGTAMLWQTGAGNYLWTTLLMMLFLLPYRRFVAGEMVYSNKFGAVVGMFLLGVLAGWGNENTSGSCILVVLVLLISRLINRRGLVPWTLSGLAGAVVGFCAMIFAPGNALRSAAEYAELPRRTLIEKVMNATDALHQHFFWALLLFVALLSLQLVFGKHKERAFFAAGFAIASIAGVYALALAPYVTTRALSGSMVFLVVACTNTLPGEYRRIEAIKVCHLAMVGILAVIAFFGFMDANDDMIRLGTVAKARDEHVQRQIEKGRKRVYVPQMPVPRSKYSPLYGLSDLQFDYNYIMNQAYAYHYNLDRVSAIPYEEWKDAYFSQDQ